MERVYFRPQWWIMNHIILELKLDSPNKEKVFIQQFNNRAFTQFKDQSPVILRVRYCNPENLIF